MAAGVTTLGNSSGCDVLAAVDAPSASAAELSRLFAGAGDGWSSERHADRQDGAKRAPVRTLEAVITLRSVAV
jgi:hypothetical protein